MSDWVLSVEGTEAGRIAAMLLALLSAVTHAAFGALQKGRHDPWLSRAAVDIGYGGIAAVLLVLFVPLPEPYLWPVFAGMMAIHVTYKALMAMAYQRGAYMVVYPIVRGTGPLVTVLFAGFLFGEHFTRVQWLGVWLLSGGIFVLAAVNFRTSALAARHALAAAIGFALLAGVTVAGYTTYDAYGIRLSPDPFTFLVWFFFLDGFSFAILSLPKWLPAARRAPVGPLAMRGLAGGVMAYVSFGGVMLATRLDKVGEAAVLRETSVVFAGLIGWLFLRERVGMLRSALLIVIAAGAVVVEFGV
ncbi:MAG: EamA family transporter [Paracoccaceae bacterium]